MVKDRLTIGSTILETSDIRIESRIPARKAEFEDSLDRKSVV